MPGGRLFFLRHKGIYLAFHKVLLFHFEGINISTAIVMAIDAVEAGPDNW